MSTVGEVLVGFVILVSLAGIVLPVLPGLALTVGAVLVWALVEATPIAWIVFAICFGLGAAATVIKYLIPGRKLKESGVAMSTMLIALFGAVIGFFVIPVVGAPIGFLAGIYLIQWNRMGRSEAWPATLRTAGAIALSIGIELAGGLLIFGVWLVAAIWG
ncbi:MAG: DUF456 domain-containing protein [Acidimicrobiia bacterium]